MSWRLARSLETLKAEVEAKWPGTTVWTVGDADHRARPSDHNPDDHDDDASTPGVVSAIDVVGAKQAAALWKHLLDTRDERVEYMIYRGKWTGSDFSWQVKTYNGANPHHNHCHVSVGRGSDSNLTRPDLFDDDSGWGLAKAGTSTAPTGGNTVAGLKVEDLQKALIEAGHDLGNFTPVKGYPKGADGDYGDVTHTAFVRALKAVGRGISQADADARYSRKAHGHRALVEIEV